jgi:hypothetical protein
MPMPPAVSTGPSPPIVPPAPPAAAYPASTAARPAYPRREKERSSALPVIVGAVALALVAVVAMVVFRGSKSDETRPPQVSRPPIEAPAPAIEMEVPARPEPPPERRVEPPPESRPEPEPPRRRPRWERQHPGHVPIGRRTADGIRLGDPANPGEIRSLACHDGMVTSVVLARAGKFALSGGVDQTVRLWDLESGDQLRDFPGADAAVLSVALSADGNRVLACSGTIDPPSDGMVRVWESGTSQQVHEFAVGDAKLAWAACFSPDAKSVLLGCEDGTLRLVDLDDQAAALKVPAHEGPVRAVALSSSGDTIASAGADGKVRLWNRFNGQPLRTMTGHAGGVAAVAFSPDGQHLLSAGDDKTVRYWDVQTGRQQQCCQGHTDKVTCVAHSPDGPMAISGGCDGTIRLWNLGTGREIRRFEKHSGPVRSVDCSRFDKLAISAGDDQTVRLWQLPDASLVARQPAGGPPPEAIRKLPLPDQGTHQRALAEIKDREFQEAFAQADRPSKRLDLARRLLAEGVKSEGDPARTYGLLRLAWNHATELGDPETAMAAVAEIGKRFEVDVVAAKSATLTSLAKAMEGAASPRKRELAETILATADEAVADANFDAARQLIDTARSVAAGARDPQLLSTVAGQADRVEGLRPSGQAAQQAIQKLKTAPNDPAANLELGKYHCFVLGNWEKGLSRLAASSDPQLQPLAQAEQECPEDAQSRLRLADRWWEAAGSQQGGVQEGIRKHAAGLYEKLVPQLEAADAARVKKRIEESQGSQPPEGSKDAPSDKPRRRKGPPAR